jgi:1-phosphatidylinositol phosphodiesterase
MKNYVQNWGVLICIIGTLLTSCQTSLSDEIQAANIESTTAGKQIKKGLTAKVANYTMSNWMGALDENLKLTALSIPGTHDSGARFEPFSGTAICQSLTIDEQLKAGVRYLDIRCRHLDNNFVIHHGPIYQKINFTNVISSCASFLAQNPSETIIMSVKEEYDASGNNRSFEATFDSYFNLNTNLWFVGTTVPTLKSAKGKIVLLRRFPASSSKGIDASVWSDNTVFDIIGAQSVKVQDQYKVPENDPKFNLIYTLAEEAKNGNDSKLYLNYCSGYKPGLFGIPNISTVSNSINPKVTSYFETKPKGHYGVIIMDFAVASRNSLVVKTNF